MVSSPLQLSFLLRGSEAGVHVFTTRRRAFEVGMASFALGHEAGGRATNIFGGTVAATHLLRVDDFLAQSAWLLTAGTEGNDVETHGLCEAWYG